MAYRIEYPYEFAKRIVFDFENVLNTDNEIGNQEWKCSDERNSVEAITVGTYCYEVISDDDCIYAKYKNHTLFWSFSIDIW